MSWARRLKRVFGIEIVACTRCGGALKIIASIEEPKVIVKILAHLKRTAPERHQADRLWVLCARIRPIGKEGRVWGRGQDSQNPAGSLAG